MENMGNITSLSIWAPDKPNPKTISKSPPYCHSQPGRFWQKGVLGILEKLVHAGVKLTHFGIHAVNDDDDPKERSLLEELLSRLTTEAPRYLPFAKTLDSSVDSCISRYQPKLRADRILCNGRVTLPPVPPPPVAPTPNLDDPRVVVIPDLFPPPPPIAPTPNLDDPRVAIVPDLFPPPPTTGPKHRGDRAGDGASYQRQLPIKRTPGPFTSSPEAGPFTSSPEDDDYTSHFQFRSPPSGHSSDDKPAARLLYPASKLVKEGMANASQERAKALQEGRAKALEWAKLQNINRGQHRLKINLNTTKPLSVKKKQQQWVKGQLYSTEVYDHDMGMEDILLRNGFEFDADDEVTAADVIMSSEFNYALKDCVDEAITDELLDASVRDMIISECNSILNAFNPFCQHSWQCILCYRKKTGKKVSWASPPVLPPT